MQSKSAPAASPTIPEIPKLPVPTLQTTVADQTKYRYHLTNPTAALYQAAGPSALTPTQYAQHATAFAIHAAARNGRPNAPIVTATGVERPKECKEFWKRAADLGVPTWPLPSETHDWGKDADGKDFGDYTIKELAHHRIAKARQTAEKLANSRRGDSIRPVETTKTNDTMEKETHDTVTKDTRETVVGTPDKQTESVAETAEQSSATSAEAERLAIGTKETISDATGADLALEGCDLATVELYKEVAAPLASSPEWADIEPIAFEEGPQALTTIMYAQEYVEGKRPHLLGDDYSSLTSHTSHRLFACGYD